MCHSLIPDNSRRVKNEGLISFMIPYFTFFCFMCYITNTTRTEGREEAKAHSACGDYELVSSYKAAILFMDSHYLFKAEEGGYNHNRTDINFQDQEVWIQAK